MSEIRNIDDKYFKEVIENPKIAASLMEIILPEEIREIIDLESLKLEKDSFISGELKEAYSDLLFQTGLKGEEEIYIYLLIEHKSYPDRYTILQLLKYMVNIWERDLRKENKKELTPIIPIVFYHGERKWEIIKSIADITKGIKEYPKLKEYLPVFRYILYEPEDLKEIEGIENPGLKTFLLSLFLARELKNPESLIKMVLRYLDSLPEDYEYLFKATIIFVFHKVDIEPERLIEYIRELKPERREDLMTLAERLRREGLEEGIRRGMEEGIRRGIKEGIEEGIKKGKKEGKEEGREETALKALQKGLDIETIAEITGLSIERIEELKKRLN
ncbi:conserved hypothetical protein (putative transposase or invertase) [Thermosyntropha lipolytica DSM 11003]|uniref:Transposase (putative) YhgA-like domain-containing protein n=1 Tax=Thermosyntropha lipolytica DSM 11003 TaxID=1123382 RepID=A0A1M5K554_9FIRM|nr:Rpn family recombination-promoting nuclease/putative transposase [Thermosyntropha lipolytica]SHG47967.1 conserved hypothetical protein (putative transposase or invertase) [Thermosyntropha lipolytica DSM 11003]